MVEGLRGDVQEEKGLAVSFTRVPISLKLAISRALESDETDPILIEGIIHIE